MRKENSGSAGKGYLTKQNFVSFIEDNPYIKEIELSNSGEVFLNPDLTDILRISLERNIKITLGNGVNLNTVTDEQLEALVKYGVSYMTVSIDGASQEIYSAYRRNGNLDKVLGNIEKINQYKKKYKTDLPYMNWQFIAFKNNMHEVDKARELAGKLNMHFYLKRDWGGFDPEGSEATKTGEGADNTKPASAVPESTPASGNENPTGNTLKPEEDPVVLIDDICAQMLFSPQINWDGRLLGCCRVYKEDWKVNVFNERSLIKALKDKDYRRGICALLNKSEGLNEGMPCFYCYFKDKYMF